MEKPGFIAGTATASGQTMAGQENGEVYSVNQLAEALGVTPRTIRFYESKGLLAPRRQGNSRVFTHRDRARLLLVLRGRRLGFTLDEIREYLDLYAADRSQTAQMKLLLEHTRRRIQTLEDQRRDLDQTLADLRDIERQALAALAGRAANESLLSPVGGDSLPAPPAGKARLRQ